MSLRFIQMDIQSFKNKNAVIESFLRIRKRFLLALVIFYEKLIF
jgi:hypothetical protein